jgi:hypothetical protein
MHVDNHTSIVPTNCTGFLLKAQDITIRTFVFVFLAPTCFSPRGGHLQGAQCQCLAKVINDYNSLKITLK